MPPPGNFVEIKALQLAGGISKQPPYERFPGQVSDAKNATFTLADGASKRPGSILVAKLNNTNPSGGPNFTSGGLYRLHVISRDANEKYLVVYGPDILRVFHVDGTEARVVGLNALSLTPQAADYFASNNATAAQLRFVSIADYTLIANATVKLGVSATPTYTVTAEWPTYEQMTSHTPTSLAGSTSINLAGDQTYHRTNKDSASEPAGYYLYSVTGNTFPTMQFAAVGSGSGGTPAEWADATPRGFKIRFEKRQDTFTNASWTAATKRLILSNNWSGYNFQAGDQIYVASGTGWSAGWYTIVQKIDASTLLLASGSASNGANVTGAGIGQEYRVEFPGTGGLEPSMHDVALFIQIQLQAAGAPDALVEWTDTAPQAGYFTITGPWRGTGAKITTVTANPSPPGGDISNGSSGDQARSGGPFDPAGAVLVLGGGSGPRTLPVDQRWTRVAAPGDVDGLIDATKAPIKLVRTTAPSTGSITAISVANPTHITSTAHGLTTGQTVAIVGTNTSATTVGSFLVTVLDADHFTIPVNVATVTTGTGTWVSNALFTYDFNVWSARTSGTDITNPTPAMFLKKYTIADMSFYRQRLLIAAGERVTMSAVDDLFRFYLDDANNLVDSDPIDAPLSGDRVTILDYLTPVRDTVMATTFAGQQYAVGAPDTLSPSTVSWTRSTTIQTLRTKPVVLDPTVYMVSAAGGKSQLREAFFVDASVPTDASDVSAHVSPTAAETGLLPADIQTLAAHSNSRTILLLPRPGGNVIYTYKTFWSGSRKEQSAWSTWPLDTGTRISDIGVIDDYLYQLVEHTDGTTSQFAIEKIPMFEPSPGAYPFALHMDRQIPFAAGSGIFATGVTTWTLPGGLSDKTLDTIVSTTGASIPVLAANGTTVTATGDLSGVAVTIGRSYTFSVTLSEPYPTDFQAHVDYQRSPELSLLMQQKRLVTVHVTSGAYSVLMAYEAGTTTFTYTPPLDITASPVLHVITGQACHWAMGDLSRATITIQSSAPTPTTIAGYSQHGEWAPRTH